ncbi:hypothetical protein BC830DRAFT_1168236 [Chytriomyces sp. MP71]|nr:hypothetical protein BC830DRAFT_1168236 [Chytriomyces sp. MP71]
MADEASWNGHHSDDGEQSQQRKKVGRKRTTSEPLTKKQEQTRRAQRNFRERQQNYVRTLEQKAEGLAAIVSSERQEAAALRKRIAHLEALLAAGGGSSVAEGVLVGVGLPSEMGSSLAAHPPPQTPASREISDASKPEHMDSEFTTVCTSPACAAHKALLAAEVATLQLELSSLRLDHSRFKQHAFASSNLLGTSDTAVLPVKIFDTPSSSFVNEALNWMDIASLAQRRNSRSFSEPDRENSVIIESGSTQALTGKQVAAAELYGPPQVEFARQMCKSIPSLREVQDVDVLYSLFVVQAKCCDTTMLLKYHVQIVRAWYKMFDAVRDIPADKKALLDVDEVFHLINKDHMNHFYSIAALGARHDPNNSFASSTSITATNLDLLRDELLSIPSLSNCNELIETLCRTFARPANQGFFANSVVVRQLERQCNSQDRARLLSALYKLRMADTAKHESVFEDVLSSLDRISIS